MTERNVTVAMTGKRNILVVNSPLSKATKKKLKACQHEKQNRERIILPPEKENQTNMRFFFFDTQTCGSHCKTKCVQLNLFEIAYFIRIFLLLPDKTVGEITRKYTC